MVTRSTHVIRLGRRARIATALITVGVGLAAVPATTALASSGKGPAPSVTRPAAQVGTQGRKGSPDRGRRTPPPKPGRGGHGGQGEHGTPMPAAWELLGKLFVPAQCSEHGRGPAWGQVLHGDLTLNTPAGPVPVTVQAGTITALDTTSFTVTSADGYVLTWSLAAGGHVLYPGRPDAFGSLAPGQLVTVLNAPSGASPGPTSTATSTPTSTATGPAPASAAATGTASATLVVVRPCSAHPAPTTSAPPTTTSTVTPTDTTSPSTSPSS